MPNDTIYALSSGALPSGVAIVRVSGPQVPQVCKAILGRMPEARRAAFGAFRHPESGDLLDEGIALHFPGPASFTGEDVLELHGHGGVASVAALLAALAAIPGLRLAEAGEFSRRAFENGRLDLTELEGLSDLISAQTEAQRRQALSQAGGALRSLYEGWRETIVRGRALIEAEFDFAEEEDVPGSVSDRIWPEMAALRTEISDHLNDEGRGEITRRGLRVALMGPPNAGKSSLLNALAKRDVAIVTHQAGTTRDVIDVPLRIGDHLVTVTDTAGLREADDIVEQEGIRRARQAAREADILLWLSPADDPVAPPDDLPEAIIVSTKVDLASAEGLTVSTIRPGGLDRLLSFLESELASRRLSGEDVLLTRQRHRDALLSVVEALTEALDVGHELTLRAEYLRLAGDNLGRLTGRIDPEDLLDVIFAEFCVGK